MTNILSRSNNLSITDFDKISSRAGKDAWVTYIDGYVPPGYEATSIMDIIYNEDPCWKTGNQVGIYLGVARPRVEPIKVGDKVKIIYNGEPSPSFTHEVICIHNQVAWIRETSQTNVYVSVKVEGLEKVND